MIDLAAHPPKLFVLDTNVLLHDAGCIDHFEENDIAIPITVLEELDRFKRGNEDINFQAREFLRRFDDMVGDLLSPQGVSLGEGRGSIRVVLGGEMDDEVRIAFQHDTPDHRILNTTLRVQRSAPQRKVVLVSKDTNLRLKAKSLGILAQDYTSDKVASADLLYSGKRVLENAPQALIEAFRANGGVVPASEVEATPAPIPNENFIIRNSGGSVLATYHHASQTFKRVETVTASGIVPRNAEQHFAIQALLNDDIKLVTLAGKAGTGKTLLALAAALERNESTRQVMLARPIVPLSNRDLGFLPGDIHEKLDPYMQPLFDNLTYIKHQLSENGPAAKRIEKMRETDKLVITPLAYIRGRTLQRTYFIIDEAQNLTPHEVKTIVTRAGAGTKIVLTGDLQQIDQPYLDSLSNGFAYLISRMSGQPIYAHITLEKGERSELASLASDLL